MDDMSGKEKSVEHQPELIQNIHWGFAKTQILASAVELDIFSRIHEGNYALEKIARAIGSPLRSTRIFLDALVGMGLLNKTRGNYKLTTESKTFLVKGESDYLGAYLMGPDQRFKAWLGLTPAVKAGRPGEDFLDVEQRKNFFKELVKALFPVSYASAVILCKKLGVGKTLQGLKVLDVGCGAAPWSLAFAMADSSTKVMALDYPEILEIAQGYVKRFHATKQFEFQGGDFHELSLGRESYDAIVLGHICHGEGENETRKLFKRCFEGLKAGGRLLVAEFIANDLRTGPEIPLMFAINMLLFTEQGDVFTGKELKRWLNLVGFKKISSQAVQYPTAVIVATK